ncbi:RluA family pseudouridine synthase [Namhaeicola litoreus]|uniref:RluA family pseudouridine synthase n=1 Tax=Namhaeicola litoreus TaxID=1052145 RepID=A0ABW3XZ35_9FLAO
MDSDKSDVNNLQVLHEDNHLIIINKRVGDIVQGDKTGDKPLSDITKEYLAKKYSKPGDVFLGVVHRLDRPTSGAVIFAKTSKALARLNKMLVDKKIDKTYWAIVDGKISEPQTLIHYLKKNPKNNKATVYSNQTEGAKRAVLHLEVLRHLDRYTLLEIDLETGRHHQIRSQLAFIGHPIKGDVKYGFRRPNKNAGINLHARKIAFVHPVSQEEIEVVAPTPIEDTLWNIKDI